MARSSSKSNTGSRITFFIIFIFFVSGLMGYRLFHLTFIEHQGFVQAAKRQYVNTSELLIGRGTLYMSDIDPEVRHVLSTNKNTLLVFTDNKKVNLGNSAIDTLAGILDMESVEIRELTQINTAYQVIKRDLTEEQVKLINELNFEGVTVTSEIMRYYPEETRAAHLAGFVGFSVNDRVGQYGVESYYDDVLSGANKTQDLLSSTTFSRIARFFGGGDPDNVAKMEEQNGEDVVLTIDAMIQEFVEAKLDEVIERWDAPSGSIIVQDPQTGAILAMASVPAYNPNMYWEYELENFINPVVQEIYEPGSTFKPITMSGAMDSKAVAPSTTYNDTGSVKIGEYTLSNFDGKARGIQTMREVLQKSLNTGTIFAQKQMGNDAFLNYVVGFGFGEHTGVDLSGEISGNILNLYEDRRVNFAAASFGQGIAVTPLQLINAYSAIANGGRLMRPYVVEEIVHADGTVAKTEPEIIDSPISQRTAKQMQSILTDVVDNSPMRARVEGYDVAAKTGTAQIPDLQGGYMKEEVIHNFVGFAPSYAPRFVVMIKLDEPEDVQYAASSLAAPFAEITRFLLNHYNIPPTR